jgi:hypothetical protein
MKPWKVLLGIGGACAACCTLPLAAGVATLAGTSTAMLAYADLLAPVAWAGVGVALTAAAVWLWRRRAAARAPACGCSQA